MKQIIYIVFLLITAVLISCNNHHKPHDVDKPISEKDFNEKSELQEGKEVNNEEAPMIYVNLYGDEEDMNDVDYIEPEPEPEEESYSSAWGGASSVDELKAKIEGTAWLCKANDGLKFRFEFNNGRIKKYSEQKDDGGSHTEYVEYPDYTIVQKNTTDGQQYLLVSFGDGSDIDHAHQQIIFINQGRFVSWLIEGQPVGQLYFQ